MEHVIYVYSASHMIQICNIIKALWIVKYDICWNYTQFVHEETFLTEMLHYFEKAIHFETVRDIYMKFETLLVKICLFRIDFLVTGF